MKLRLYIAGLTSFLLSSCADSAPTWHMINCNIVSQGDCHLLEDNSIYTLIDAGEAFMAEKSLVPYLRKRQIDEIDHFFISHPHTDHYGGLETLRTANISVKNIYHNALPEDVSDYNYKPIEFNSVLKSYKASGTTLHNIKAGFTLELPNSKIYLLEAKKEHQSSVNDYSLIMAWDAGGYRTLFTGDLGKQVGTELVNRDDIKADILKVPHHGVTGIAPNEFFDKVNPSLILVPAPKSLSYDVRGSQVKNWAINNWNNKNTHICTNGFNGDVRITFYSDYVLLDPQVPNETCPQKKWYLEPINKIQLAS